MVKFLKLPPRKSRYHYLKMLVSFGLGLAMGGFPFFVFPLIHRLVRRYVLPEDHPLKAKLDALVDRETFVDTKSAEANNWQAVSAERILVAAHPELDGYLIKSYSTEFKQPTYPTALYRYVRRIRLVRKLRSLIERFNCKHLVAPQKWLYRIPKTDTYLLVAERIDTRDSSEALANLNEEQVEEFARVFRGMDGFALYPRNIPLTSDGKFAFIDTDHHGVYKNGWEKEVVSQLAPERQQQAREIWQKLTKKQHFAEKKWNLDPVEKRRIRFFRVKAFGRYLLRLLRLCFPFIAYPLIHRLVRPYLLPKDHPLIPKLDVVCADLDLFKSRVNLVHAGWTLHDVSSRSGWWTIIVASRPEIEGYVIKTYSTEFKDPTYDVALYRYVRRVRNSQRLRRCLDEHHCNHLVAPRKWLYRLPKSQTYVIIAEKLDILPGSHEAGEILERYASISKEQLEELATVFYAVDGVDAFLQNIPFTTDEKIAFIDTDHVGVYPDAWEGRIVPHLPPELQDYAREFYRNLAS